MIALVCKMRERFLFYVAQMKKNYAIVKYVL